MDTGKRIYFVMMGAIYMNMQAISFPKPAGEYAIGTRSLHLVDESRRERLSTDPLHPYRELMVQLWYPAQGDKDAHPTTSYAPDAIKHWKHKIISKQASVASEQLAQLDTIFVHAQPNAAVAEGRFPIVLFCAGYACMRTHNSALCESLASHGYIVVSIDHTYFAEQVTFPDGRSIAAVEVPGLSQTDKQKQQEVADIFVADVGFVVSHMIALNGDANEVFYRHLEVDHIGMFGHSTGGSTTLHATKRIAQIKAGINLDGGIWGNIEPLEKFDKPFMHVFAEDSIAWAKMSNTEYSRDIDLIHANQASDWYKIVIHGAGHMSFCDSIFLKDTALAPILFLQFGLGSLAAEKATELASFSILQFFDKYLKDKETHIKEAMATRAEIEVL